MSVEFDPRFVALLEAEQQRLVFGSSKEQTAGPGSSSVRRSGDGFGGRFSESSELNAGFRARNTHSSMDERAHAGA
ncbi:MAG: hypothetical protein M1405_03200 [Patescibacteria group bacterium]|nr:hypothetical protein [Patescibacteria group bacterium]